MRKIGLIMLLVLSMISAGCGSSGGGEIGTISGIISDAAAGALSDVTMTTEPATSTVNTDATGNYTFSNVSPGDYTITASRNGYADQRQSHRYR